MTRLTRKITAAATAAVATVGLAACGSSGGGSSSGSLTKVTLQLQWFRQAQFAGYITALTKGYYKDEGLDVSIKDGGTDIVPQTVLASGKADYAIAWVPKALQSREKGANITDVGQVFQRHIAGRRRVVEPAVGVLLDDDAFARLGGVIRVGHAESFVRAAEAENCSALQYRGCERIGN